MSVVLSVGLHVECKFDSTRPLRRALKYTWSEYLIIGLRVECRFDSTRRALRRALAYTWNVKLTYIAYVCDLVRSAF